MADAESNLHACRRDRITTILVVEDENQIRLVVSDFLRECGFRVVASMTADHAVELLQNGALKMDLIFSDIRMPGKMNGWDLARWARNNRPDLPIILATGDTGFGNSDCNQGLADLVLAKPYSLHRLAEKIREMAGLSQCGTL